MLLLVAGLSAWVALAARAAGQSSLAAAAVGGGSNNTPAPLVVRPPEAPGGQTGGTSLKPNPLTTSRIRIALYKGDGTGGAGPTNMIKYFNSGTNATIVQVTPEEIRDGILKDYDVIIFGGGSGSKEAATIGEAGRQQVKEFIQGGGGYIGICAGAYLATSGYPWSLHVLDAKTASPKWRRGKGTVKIELTDKGRSLLGDVPGLLDIHYANGPILKPAGLPELEAFETLACFRTELAENETPAGLMINSPAIVAGRFGKGRLICFSPHPEQTKGLESFVEKAVFWVRPGVPPQPPSAQPAP
jgi:putative intracellular protease/amidase